MSGFDNDVVYANNADFSTVGAGGGSATNGLQTNGQLWIGTTTPNVGGTNVSVGAITSPLGTVSVGYSAPNITLDISGGAAAIESLTPNSGTSPVVPNGSGNITLQGTGSITTVGGTNSLTPQLTGLTNHSVLVGAGTATITKVGPTATAGQVFQSGGSTADPAFSTATYPLTTTANQLLYSSATNTLAGLTTANNGVLITSSSGVPSLLAAGTTGQVLTATTGSPPSWGTASSSGITSLTTNVSGPVTPSAGAVAVTGTNVYSSGSVANTLTLNVQATSNLLLVGAGTNTPATTIATANSALLNTNGSGVPAWQTSPVVSGEISALQGYVGNITGSAPFGGTIGEMTFASASVSAVTNNTVKATSIVLSAGCWDIQGSVNFTAAAITGTLFEASISNSAVSRGLVPAAAVDTPTAPTAASGVTLVTPVVRVNLSASATYSCIAYALFSAGSLTSSCFFRATRVA